MAISTVTFEAGGQSHTARLTTRAGRRLEKSTGKSIIALSRTLDQDIGFELLTVFFAATINDGAGGTEEEAEQIIDDLGGVAGAAKVLGDILEKAFPNEGGGKSSGNAKRKA